MNISKIERAFQDLRLECENGEDALCENMQCSCGKDQIRALFENQCQTIFGSITDKYFITICPDSNNYYVGQLNRFDPLIEIPIIRNRIRKTGIKELKCIGYIDIQITEYVSVAKARHSMWNVHYHILASSKDPASTVKEKIYKEFNAGQNKWSARVINISKWPFAYPYIVKYIHEMTKRSQPGIQNQGRRKQSLTGKQMKELIEVVQYQNSLSWILLIGLRRSGNRFINIEAK